MILEVVQWKAREGRERAFELAFGEAQEFLVRAEGYLSHRFFKCIETSSKYMLLVEWSSLEAHTEKFRGSESYQQYRALLKPHYEEGATLEHYE
jgi:heme-degrading monooxygenase HmoA